MVNVNEYIFEQIGSRKVNENPEMSEKSRKESRRFGIMKKILSKFSGFLSNLTSDEVIEVSSDIKEFDSVIEQLKNPHLEDSDRKKLVRQAEEMIDASRYSYEKILSSSKLTPEQKGKIKKRQSIFVSNMQIKLKKALRELEENNNMKVEPIVLEKKNTITREELLEELRKLNPEANLQMFGSIVPYFTSLIPEEELVLPEGFYYDEKYGITNRNNVEGKEYISIKAIVVTPEDEKTKDNNTDMLAGMDDEFTDLDETNYDSDTPKAKDDEKDSTEEVSNDDSEEEFKQDDDAEEKTEETSENDIIELADLTQFDSYSDYLIQYRKKFISERDYDKFMNSVIRSFTEGTKIVNVLSEEEFVDEKRKQLEKIEQRKIEEKRRKVEIKLIDTENKLVEANEKVQMLTRQADEYRVRLNEMRINNNTLEQEVSKQNNTNFELSEENRELMNQVSVRDNSIKAQQKQVFELQRLLDKERKARNEANLKIESLEDQLEMSKRNEEIKEKEISRLNENTRKWRENLSAELNKLSPDDDLEKTAIEWVKQRDEFFENREEAEEQGKHFSEEPKTEGEVEIEKLKQGMRKLNELINDGSDVDTYDEIKHLR